MQIPTLQECQNTSIESVYFTLIIEKGAKGRIPSMAIHKVARINHNLVKLGFGGVINPKKYLLMSTKPISEYYQKEQYKLYMDEGHLCIAFDDDEPFKRYVEFAGRSFDKYCRENNLH